MGLRRSLDAACRWQASHTLRTYRSEFPSMKEGLQPSPVESADAKCKRLREENARLRQLLAEHNTPIPPNQPANPPAVKSVLPLEDRKERARKRIALFRSLFRGREGVYA